MDVRVKAEAKQLIVPVTLNFLGATPGIFCFVLRVRVRIRVHVTGGVLARGLTYVGRLSEQPHWRWPNQGAAVAKLWGPQYETKETSLHLKPESYV